jgi:hypothetical protein
MSDKVEITAELAARLEEQMRPKEYPRIGPPVPFFLCFSGKKQTGKDTSSEICSRILKQQGLKVRSTSFAYPLKHICIHILGMSVDACYGTDKDKDKNSNILWQNMPLEIRKKYQRTIVGSHGKAFVDPSGPMTNREVLQVLGTDIFRTFFDTDVWAKYPFREDWDGYDVVLLTDCRFPNEKIVTEENGGVIIRLERDTGLEDNHPSEIALDEFTFKHTYQNNGSLEDLEEYLTGKLKEFELI